MLLLYTACFPFSLLLIKNNCLSSADKLIGIPITAAVCSVLDALRAARTCASREQIEATLISPLVAKPQCYEHAVVVTLCTRC